METSVIFGHFQFPIPEPWFEMLIVSDKMQISDTYYFFLRFVAWIIILLLNKEYPIVKSWDHQKIFTSGSLFLFLPIPLLSLFYPLSACGGANRSPFFLHCRELRFDSSNNSKLFISRSLSLSRISVLPVQKNVDTLMEANYSILLRAEIWQFISS